MVGKRKTYFLFIGSSGEKGYTGVPNTERLAIPMFVLLKIDVLWNSSSLDDLVT